MANKRHSYSFPTRIEYGPGAMKDFTAIVKEAGEKKDWLLPIKELKREEKLTGEGYFRSHEDLANFVSDLKTIYKDPARKDLRWKYGIDEDVLSDDIRELEFANWIKYQILKK